jgi:hypothetical protein
MNRVPRLLPIILLASLIPSPVAAWQTDQTAFGTLIGAYGNKNGIAVVTDSMVSTFGPDGQLHPNPLDPAQKLLKLDDSTVCAVAGYGRIGVVAAPTLTGDMLAIVRHLFDSSGSTPLSKNLDNVAAGISFYFETVARIDVATHQPLNLFNLELLLAGYEPQNRQPEIGSVVIQVIQPGFKIPERVPEPVARITEKQIWRVGDTFLPKTHGMDLWAKEILNWPDSFIDPRFPIIEKLAQAEHADGGASLSLQDMADIGKTLVLITTSKTSTGEGTSFVGGEIQMATLTAGKAQIVSSGHYPELHQPTNFFVMKNVGVQGRGFFFQGPVTVFYDSGTFVGPTSIPVVVDRNVFVNCRFVNQTLEYNGEMAWFDDSNVLENVQVSLGPNAYNHPEIATKLRRMAEASRKDAPRAKN